MFFCFIVDESYEMMDVSIPDIKDMGCDSAKFENMYFASYDANLEIDKAASQCVTVEFKETGNKRVEKIEKRLQKIFQTKGNEHEGPFFKCVIVNDNKKVPNATRTKLSIFSVVFDVTPKVGDMLMLMAGFFDSDQPVEKMFEGNFRFFPINIFGTWNELAFSMDTLTECKNL